MSTNTTGSSKRGLIIGAICVVLLSGGGLLAFNAGLFDNSSSELTSGDATRVMDALSSIDNEKLASADKEAARAKAFDTLKEASLETVFERLRSDELDDAQKEALRENLGTMMREDMERKVDEYSSAPEEEKEKIMDRHIDEMLAFRDKMRAYREKHQDDPEFEKEREERRKNRKAPTKEQRKKRMEGRNPDTMAKMMRYWPKMMARAKERGVEIGWGRGGRGGGKRGDK